MKRWLLMLALLTLARPAGATGFTDYGADLEAPPSWFDVGGYLRTRGVILNNLDLDRGLTPSGEAFYPVDITDPAAQTLTRADIRLRGDLAAYWPDGGLAVKARVDVLDNVLLGSAADGVPSASVTQRHDASTIMVKRAYGEVLTPFGLLAGGRMGTHWGLGMLANGGDCDNCDFGDAADRIAFITPILSHLWAVAFDFTATGPFVPTRNEQLAVDIAPSVNVYSLTFAMLNYRSPGSLLRRRKAGRWTGEYGAYVSHRWQTDDIPGTYLATASPIEIDASQVMSRGFTATAADVWFRVTSDVARLELEAAYLHANVAQASLIPGALFRDPVTSDQFGLAAETSFGPIDHDWELGVDGGFASGDSAPGFGAFPKAGQLSPVRGDLDGPQARPPFDNATDNFRFHPDYQVDRILFREIIGTVTDAGYIRPHASVALFNNHRGALHLGVAAIASFAVFAESAPGGDKPLGLEIDPTLAYVSPFGFRAAIEQATLVPFAGLDNPQAGLDARVAHLWRLRLMYGF
jgi:uncharacterized protein (TIGR04551 family)